MRALISLKHTKMFLCLSAAIFAHGQIISSAQTSESVSPAVRPQPSAKEDATLQAFVAQQAILTQQRTELVSKGATPDQLRAWYEQNASLFALQRERAQAMALDSAPQPEAQNGHGKENQLQSQRRQTLALEAMRTPLPLPRPPKASVGTTPQRAAFQNLLYQFMLNRALVWNQNLNADPAVREKAMQAWRRQSLDQVKQLQQQAQSLARSPSPNQK